MPRKGRPKKNPDDLGYIKPEYYPPKPGVIEKQRKNLNRERIEDALTKIYYMANDTNQVRYGDKKELQALASTLEDLL